MNNSRRLATLGAGLALSALAFTATAPAAFAIIPGPAHPPTVAAKYVPPAPVTAGPSVARQALSNVGGHHARHEARHQPDPIPVAPAAGHTGIIPA